MEEGSNPCSAQGILSGIILPSSPSGDQGLRRAGGVSTRAWVLKVTSPFNRDQCCSAEYDEPPPSQMGCVHLCWLRICFLFVSQVTWKNKFGNNIIVPTL